MPRWVLTSRPPHSAAAVSSAARCTRASLHPSVGLVIHSANVRWEGRNQLLADSGGQRHGSAGPPST